MDSELMDWWLYPLDLPLHWPLHGHLASNPFFRIIHFDFDFSTWGIAYNFCVYIYDMRTRLEISLNSMIMPKILVPAEAHTHTIGKTERTWKEDVKKWLQERHLDLDKHLKHWLLGHSAYMWIPPMHLVPWVHLNPWQHRRSFVSPSLRYTSPYRRENWSHQSNQCQSQIWDQGHRVDRHREGYPSRPLWRRNDSSRRQEKNTDDLQEQ